MAASNADRQRTYRNRHRALQRATRAAVAEVMPQIEQEARLVVGESATARQRRDAAAKLKRQVARAVKPQLREAVESAESVNDAVEPLSGSPNGQSRSGYVRGDLSEALEVGRMTAVAEMALKGSVEASISLIDWWTDQSPLRWLFRDWMAGNHPVEWQEWERRHLDR
ncbi:MAG: hypothetical protein ACYCU5_16300 [Actinomycetes bacterium]